MLPDNHLEGDGHAGGRGLGLWWRPLPEHMVLELRGSPSVWLLLTTTAHWTGRVAGVGNAALAPWRAVRKQEGNPQGLALQSWLGVWGCWGVRPVRDNLEELLLSEILNNCLEQSLKSSSKNSRPHLKFMASL